MLFGITPYEWIFSTLSACIYTHYSRTIQFLTASIVTIIMIVKNLITRLHLGIEGVFCLVGDRTVVVINVIPYRVGQLVASVPGVQFLLFWMIIEIKPYECQDAAIC